MIEMLVLWILGLIAISIAWGDTGMVVSVKSRVTNFAQSIQSPGRRKYAEVMIGSLFAMSVLSIMVFSGHTHVAAKDGFSTLLVWAGGLWLVPFQFDAAGHFWLAFVVSATILGGSWVWGMDFPSLRMHAQTAVSTRRRQDTSAGVTAVGFLFWISLIGLAFAAITHYTSMGTPLAASS